MAYVAFLLGLAGSLHCVGMCGPIALALPVHHLSPVKKGLGILMYNSGRILTYSLLGLLAGTAGYVAEAANWQKPLSIGVGAFLLIPVLMKASWFETAGTFAGGMHTLKRGLRHFITKRGVLSLTVMGLLNGLIPCGMVYVALLTALTQTAAADSARFMAFYGLGTFPAMLATGWAGQWASLRLRNSFRRAVPYVVALTGLLLIARGIDTADSTAQDEPAQHPIPVCGL